MATESLEEKLEGLEKMQADLEQQKHALLQLEAELKDAIEAKLAALKAAA
jgi:hypothetical protein